MAKSMNWALDPRQPKRQAATPAKSVAKTVRKSNSNQSEEDK